MKFATAFALLVVASTAGTAAAIATHLGGLDDSAGGGGIQVDVSGILRKMSPAERATFKDVLATTYKAAYGVTGDVIFKGMPCTHTWKIRCPDDPSTEDGRLSVTFGWRCNDCRQDERDGGVDATATAGSLSLYLDDDHSPARRSAWEQAFCAQLAASGAANFVNAHGCTITVDGNSDAAPAVVVSGSRATAEM